MAYARLGPNSDVYVYAGAHRAGNDFTCCWCQISDEGHFECQTPEQMLSHLSEHRTAGHMVPSYCEERLRDELDQKGSSRS